jgi:hypothetical protein
VKTGVEKFNCRKKNQNVLIHYLSRRFWFLTKIDFCSFFPALLLWKEIKQKQIPIVIWKWMSHCSRDSKCIHVQCVHLIFIISAHCKPKPCKSILTEITLFWLQGILFSFQGSLQNPVLPCTVLQCTLTSFAFIFLKFSWKYFE